MRVVALGGGHGLAASLSALRLLRPTSPVSSPWPTTAGRPAGCGTSSACCRPATSAWRSPRCAATTSGAGRGPASSSTGSRRRPAARPRRRQPADRRHLGDPRRPRRRARPGRPAARRPRPGAADGRRAARHRGRRPPARRHPTGSPSCAARCRWRASTARWSASGSTHRPAGLPRGGRGGPGGRLGGHRPGFVVHQRHAHPARARAARRAGRHRGPARCSCSTCRSRRARPRGCRRPTTSRCCRRMRPTSASTPSSPTTSLSDERGTLDDGRA